jgi:hypothetical protein
MAFGKPARCAVSASALADGFNPGARAEAVGSSLPQPAATESPTTRTTIRTALDRRMALDILI